MKSLSTPEIENVREIVTISYAYKGDVFETEREAKDVRMADLLCRRLEELGNDRNFMDTQTLLMVVKAAMELTPMLDQHCAEIERMEVKAVGPGEKSE